MPLGRVNRNALSIPVPPSLLRHRLPPFSVSLVSFPSVRARALLGLGRIRRFRKRDQDCARTVRRNLLPFNARDCVARPGVVTGLENAARGKERNVEKKREGDGDEKGKRRKEKKSREWCGRNWRRKRGGQEEKEGGGKVEERGRKNTGKESNKKGKEKNKDTRGERKKIKIQERKEKKKKVKKREKNDKDTRVERKKAENKERKKKDKDTKKKMKEK